MEITKDTLFKLTGPSGECRGGKEHWDLPHEGLPGEWTPESDTPVDCRNGHHVQRPLDLLSYSEGVLWTVEVRGMRWQDDLNPRVLVRQARLLEKVATYSERMLLCFVLDCALHVALLHDSIGETPLEPLLTKARLTLDQDDLDYVWDAASWELNTFGGAFTVKVVAAVEAATSARYASGVNNPYASERSGFWPFAISAAEDAAGFSIGHHRVEDRQEEEYKERQWQTQRMVEYLRGDIEVPKEIGPNIFTRMVNEWGKDAKP